LSIGQTRAALRPYTDSGNVVRRMKASTSLVAAVRTRGRMWGKCKVAGTNDKGRMRKRTGELARAGQET
jgi:hypothetical protein